MAIDRMYHQSIVTENISTDGYPYLVAGNTYRYIFPSSVVEAIDHCCVHCPGCGYIFFVEGTTSDSCRDVNVLLYQVLQ